MIIQYYIQYNINNSIIVDVENLVVAHSSKIVFYLQIYLFFISYLLNCNGIDNSRHQLLFYNSVVASTPLEFVSKQRQREAPIQHRILELKS